jgi:hypothetical protein
VLDSLILWLQENVVIWAPALGAALFVIVIACCCPTNLLCMIFCCAKSKSGEETRSAAQMGAMKAQNSFRDFQQRRQNSDLGGNHVPQAVAVPAHN